MRKEEGAFCIAEHAAAAQHYRHSPKPLRSSILKLREALASATRRFGTIVDDVRGRTCCHGWRKLCCGGTWSKSKAAPDLANAKTC